jgi:lysophospholipase L1-like esterase/uncharacterized protein YraI
MSVLRKISSVLLCAALIAASLCVAFPAVAAASSADSFFKDAVFLGDSITVGLEEYAQKMRASSDSTFLSNAKFLAKVGYPVTATDNSDGNSMHPAYGGVRQQPQKSIAAMGVSKVFILLGTNDVQEDFQDTIDAYTALIKAIKGACPGITIYVQSVMPMCSATESGKMTNARIETLNSKIKSMCASQSITYIDIASAMKNSYGALKTAYSSDGYVHLNNEGYAAWVSVLREFAKNAIDGYPATVANASSVNLRSEPSTSASRVATLSRGTQIRIVEPFVQDSWHKVSYGGIVGYMHSDYVQFDSTGMEMTAGRIVNVSSFVNARTGPSTEFSIPFTIRKDAVVLVATSYLADNWYLVYYDSCYVFVRRDFISLV